ncbi:involucrin repeat protein [Nannizzia gypsea CBS 118893]|uniref:Involucrin repeat protein n=1 Tax=Arthroderma gypseum (strain ATCC MYA-4604 / CBS 118893) TaxID=535722 RepID=E4V187_ARTGP|nr:involucrin repeat protein [Nannizzia gypsea CBS 118893]EFR03802.1 involucrin repeat protein [Nannizzia gypsea CBS 118893]
MMNTSIRSSEYSYRDPRYYSSSSLGNAHKTLDGYGGMMHSDDGEGSRYNHNAQLSRGSVLLNANDPVSMHLLAETAIGDSLHFEVLSFEEVEELKRELALAQSRVEGGKRKLALELKLLEAAESLNRLYDDGSNPVNGHGYGHGHGHGDQHASDEELAITRRKCEEQAQEIAKLERRASDIRTKILEHTAGVLQMTHKGLKKKKGSKTDDLSSTSDDLNGLDPYGCGHEFDHRSLYRTADYLDHHGGAPPRDVPSLEPDVESTSADLSGLQDTQSKLEEMTYRLHEMLTQMNTGQEVDPIPKIVTNNDSPDPLATVNIQVDYLEKGLETIALHQSHSSDHSARDLDAYTPEDDSASTNATIDRLDSFSRRLDEALAAAGSSRQPTSPHMSTIRKTMAEQLEYLDSAVTDVEKRIDSLVEQKTILGIQIQQQRDLNSKSDAERDAYIADLTEDLTKLRKELDKSHAADESSRAEIAVLMDQLDAARQDSMRQEQKRSIGEAPEVPHEKEALMKAEQELAEKVARISSLESTIHELRSQTDAHSQEAQLTRETVQHDLAEKTSLISTLQSSLQELHSQVDSQLGQIKEAHQSREEAEQAHAKLQTEFSELESEMVRIQTELTFARAELDSAYGSRSERAAEAAANPAVQREIDNLRERNMDLTSQIATLKSVQMNNANSASMGAHERIQMLERELRETIEDYEELTKQSIEFEKERDKFENMIDSYRDRCDTLETQLGDERIQNLGIRDGMTVENTSITVLKSEFKKMMRETRADSIKALRAEQEDRRRLESMLRAMKREQSLKKSNLSQSTLAS